jgi:hypothetical protein
VLAASSAAHMHNLRAEFLLDMAAKDSRSPEGVIKAGGSQALRLASGAGLDKEGRQVDDWLCESHTTEHCLNRYVDPSKARLNSGAESGAKGVEVHALRQL